MKTEEDIKKAVEVMRQGGVILYPTDTVWGIGCDATNAEAVAKVYKIKHRDDSKALICLVDSDNRLQRYVRNVPDVAWQLFECADKPTTVILDGAVNLAENLIADDGSIAMRITSEPFSKELCYRFQKPIVFNLCQHLWRADGTELLRHIAGNHRCRGLRLLEPPTGAQAP